MSTTNTTAELIQQLGATEAQIETDLATLATTQGAALADLQAWIAQQKAAGGLDPASQATLGDVSTKLATVDKTLQSLGAAAKAADPGAPIVVPPPVVAGP